mmetsp:Transcript_6223/g.11415  ORF Transcript_6223/g.11415 Transcript_6223/m.11415 type:complete len:368 (-) Transcript_6223:404-1507(-)
MKSHQSLLVHLAVLLATPSHTTAKSSAATPSKAIAPTATSSSPLRFSSPLQTFTLFDKPALSSPENRPPRLKFLPRFRAGLMAEKQEREKILDEQRRGISHSYWNDDDDDDAGDSWAEHSAQAEERRMKAMEQRVERAHDEAVARYDAKVAERLAARKNGGASGKESSGGYQFVGVVADGASASASSGGNSNVKWYARMKPANSKWSVRLVHVNRDAVLRDLFVKGKVDVFGRYVNEGVREAVAVSGGGVVGEEQDGMKPIVKGQYSVRERSWRTLWNFHPKRIFNTSSGSFWRERRITPGLYTDGTTVYESVYRYRDGKNGMKPVAKLERFLSNTGTGAGGLGVEEKMRLVERLKGGDVPDVVVEK